jgi:hypothetical protein
MVLSVEAYRTHNTVEARNGLLTGLQYNPHLNIFLHRHQGSVESVAFSPDGKVLASGSGDNTVILWDVEKRQPLGQPLTGHRGFVTSVAFSPDRKIVASGGLDKTVILWDVSFESWEARACRIANRNLTREEWGQFMGDEPYRKTCPDLPIHPSVIEAGRERARASDIEGAIAIFRRALELEPSLDLHPEAEARQFAALGAVAKGEALAKAGDVEGAIAQFQIHISTVDFGKSTYQGYYPVNFSIFIITGNRTMQR